MKISMQMAYVFILMVLGYVSLVYAFFKRELWGGTEFWSAIMLWAAAFLLSSFAIHFNLFSSKEECE